MSKKLEEIQKRHLLIKKLIAAKEFANHTELVKELHKNNIDVTQATLSRDLTELGIVRVPTANGFVYKIGATGDENALRFHVAEEIISIDSNEQLIVIKTYPGRAQGVALLIDRHKDSEVLGTIAGDDTIAVIPKSVVHIKKCLKTIKEILGVI